MVLLTRRAAAQQEGLELPADGNPVDPAQVTCVGPPDVNHVDSAQVTRVGPPKGIKRKKKNAMSDLPISQDSAHVTRVGPPVGMKRNQKKSVAAGQVFKDLPTAVPMPPPNQPNIFYSEEELDPLTPVEPSDDGDSMGDSNADVLPRNPAVQLSEETTQQRHSDTRVRGGVSVVGQTIPDEERDPLLTDPNRFISPDADESEALRTLQLDGRDLPASYDYGAKGKWRAIDDQHDYNPDEEEEEDELAEDEIIDPMEEGDELDDEEVDDARFDTVMVDERPLLEDEDFTHTRLRDGWPQKCGALTKDEALVCKEFGREVLSRADELAKDLGKNRRTILLEAGLTIQGGRSPSLRNEYRAWYSSTQPKVDEETAAQWRDREAADYAEWKDTVYDVASSSVKQDLRKELAVKPDDDVVNQTAAQRVKCAAKQLSSIAAAYNNMEDIEIMGAVVYVGIDHEARKGAAFFGGSTRAHFLLNHLDISAKAALDMLETCLKATKLSRTSLQDCVMELFGKNIGTQLRLPPNMNTDTRDEARKMLSTILVRKLEPFLNSSIKVKPKTFPWVRWRQYATELKVCLVNWDEDAPVPGAGCNAKSLRLGVLRTMLFPFEQEDDEEETSENAVSIEPWEWEHRLLRDTNPIWPTIPLVRGTSGKVLLSVGDVRGAGNAQKRAKLPTAKTSRHMPVSDASDVPTSPPLRRKFRRVRQEGSEESGHDEAPDLGKRRAVPRVDSEASDGSVNHSKRVPGTLAIQDNVQQDHALRNVQMAQDVHFIEPPHDPVPRRLPSVPARPRPPTHGTAVAFPTQSHDQFHQPAFRGRSHSRSQARQLPVQYPPRMAPPNNPYGFQMPYMPMGGMYPSNYPYPFPGVGQMMAGPSRIPDQFDLYEGSEEE